MLRIKRIYEDPEDSDGYRILVDKLWPRGISMERAKLDYWAKELAPTDETRKAFNHEEEKFEVFKTDYLKELEKNREARKFLTRLKEKLASGNVSLLYGAKNERYNQAIVLKEWLENKIN